MFPLYSVVAISFMSLFSVDKLGDWSTNKKISSIKKEVFSKFEPCAQQNFFKQKKFVEGKLVDIVKNSQKENQEQIIQQPTEFDALWCKGSTEELKKEYPFGLNNLTCGLIEQK